MKKVILLWWLTIPHVLAYLSSGNKDYHNVDIERNLKNEMIVIYLI